jgi:hypothetical protein
MSLAARRVLVRVLENSEGQGEERDERATEEHDEEHRLGPHCFISFLAAVYPLLIGRSGLGLRKIDGSAGPEGLEVR